MDSPALTRATADRPVRPVLRHAPVELPWITPETCIFPKCSQCGWSIPRGLSSRWPEAIFRDLWETAALPRTRLSSLSGGWQLTLAAASSSPTPGTSEFGWLTHSVSSAPWPVLGLTAFTATADLRLTLC